MKHGWAFRVWLLLAGLSSYALGQQLPPLKRPPEPPQQPIPFSHRLHVENGIECRQCHPVPEPGDFAEIVGTAVCMTCHTTIKADSPQIQKLADFHKSNERVPWEPVYLIPSYVFFSHKVHLKEVDGKCMTCHGPVGERDVLRKERDISMAACMDCHRATGASLGCTYCHEQR